MRIRCQGRESSVCQCRKLASVAIVDNATGEISYACEEHARLYEEEYLPRLNANLDEKNQISVTFSKLLDSLSVDCYSAQTLSVNEHIIWPPTPRKTHKG